MTDREPLSRSELEAVYKFYIVRMTVDRETADMLRKLPMYRHLPDKTRSFLVSQHRVGPKKFFGLARHERPNPYQIEQADWESQRVAQQKAHELLQVPGVRLVVVSWELRKEASSRFTPGPVVSDCVARLTSPDQFFIDGKPSEKALRIDRGEEV